MHSAVSAADQDRIIGAPAGGRRAIASKAISTGVKSISCVPSSLILSSNSEPVNVIRVDNGQTEEKGQVACFRVYVQGNSATQGKGEMGLDETSKARGGRS